MKDAGYFETQIDQIKTKKSDILVRRTYSSRSTYNGLFGFGWCSDFESSIKRPNSQSLILRNCDTDTEIIYKSSAQANLKAIKTTFLIIGSNLNKIEYFNGVYTHYKADGSQSRYNKSGQLVGYKSKNQTWIQVVRSESGQPKKLRARDGSEVNIVINDRINKIINLNGVSSLRYEYAEDSLISIFRSGVLIKRFFYDDARNLIKIFENGILTSEIEYDSDNDWVKSVIKNNCTEFYRFARQSSLEGHFTSSIEVKCNNKTVRSATFDFWIKRRSDGSKYLERMQINDNKKIRSVQFDAITGGAHVSE